MRIKSLVKTAAAATLTCASLASYAGMTDLGTLPIGTTNFNNSSFMTPGPTFADLLSFALPSNGGSSYAVLDYPLDLSGIVPGLVFGSLFSFVSVHSAGMDGIRFTGDDVLVAGGMVTPAAPIFSFDLPPNTGGLGYLFVSGIAPAGAVGSLYSGSITVSAAPIPEPEGYAMLLAGLGVMGAIAVRRNKSKKQG